MVSQVAQLAVDGDEPPRTDQIQHELKLLRRGVPRDVDRGDGDVEDLGAGPVQAVQGPVDRGLVARDDRR